MREVTGECTENEFANDNMPKYSGECTHAGRTCADRGSKTVRVEQRPPEWVK